MINGVVGYCGSREACPKGRAFWRVEMAQVLGLVDDGQQAQTAVDRYRVKLYPDLRTAWQQVADDYGLVP